MVVSFLRPSLYDTEEPHIHSGVMYMIDMHNHVLFGVDDGCATLEESIAMIEQAVKVGVTDLIVTPHFAPMRGFVADRSTIDANFVQMNDAVREHNLPISLYLGREIDEVSDIETLLAEATVQTMNNTKYVLVDFGMKKADIDEYVYELVIRGYKPIIAHPERYNYITDTDEFHRWRQTGALLQINATSLFHPKNKLVKKHVQYLLKHGLVDMVGSDCHKNPRNYDDFAKAIKTVQKKYPNNVLKHEVLL